MKKSGWLGWLLGKSSDQDILLDVGLLVARLGAGFFMIYGHGFDKLVNFSAKAPVFPDPLGIGSGLSLGLAVLAEFMCALLLMLGFMTRLSLIPLMSTMLVAAFLYHGTDPFSAKELPLLYLSVYVGLFLTGPGDYSMDAKMRHDPLEKLRK